tara:strand:- start:7076 stop:7375 length:300 start_codon:yes stop_codon:yes gene_type:complete
MQKLLKFLFVILFLNSKALKITPCNTKFPKMTYTKIHDISYRGPIYVPRKKPYAFMLFTQINKTLPNLINNYIDEVYAMASLPLSFIIINQFNQTYDNN